MAASGVGAAIALAAIADELPGRDRVPRHAGRGAGQRQADHDRRRPLRGHRRRAALPPVRPQPRRELSARFGGRRGRFPRPPGARVLRSVEGQERARRDDPAVLVGRAVAPAARADGPRPRDHPRGRHGRQHHPGPHLGVVHAPQRRPGLRLRGDEGAVHAHGRGRRAGDRHDRRGDVLGWRDDHAQQPAAGRALPGQHGGLRHRGHGRRPERGQHRHGQRQLGVPDDPPGPRHLRRGRRRAFDGVPRRGGDAARRRDDAARRHAGRADGRRPVPRPGAGRRRMGRVPGRSEPEPGCTIAPARPAGRRIANRRRPESRRTTRTRPRTPDRAPSPGGPRGRAPPRPRLRRP